jgi:DNA-binding response OmpR family regulator
VVLGGQIAEQDRTAMLTAIPRERCFVMLDDNGSELFIAQAYFRQAGLRNRLYLETMPEKMMNRILGLCSTGVAARDIVVLLDIRMPRMNGFELIYEIRNNITTHETKIIMLSASNNEADRQDASEIGADGYIVKPFSVKKLMTAMAA